MSEPAGGSALPPGVVEADLRTQAMKSLRRKRGFKIHLLIYCLVNAFFIATWIAVGVGTGNWFPWWVFPLFGWGIGVAIQAWNVYGGGGISEASIRREMDRLNRPRGG